MGPKRIRIKQLQLGQYYTVWFPAEEFAAHVVVLADEGGGCYLIKDEHGLESSINLNVAYSVTDSGPFLTYTEDDNDEDDDD